MILLINTQVQENYGAHDWDGEGECPQYWKYKGGNDYKVVDVPLNIDHSSVVDMLRPEIESDSVGFREHIIDWVLVEDGYLTSFEKSQLEYDGKITYPAESVEYSDLVAESV